MSHSNPISICRVHGVIVGPRCKCPGPHPEVKVDCPDEERCLRMLVAAEERLSASAEAFAERVKNSGEVYVWFPPYGELRVTNSADFSRREAVQRAISGGQVQTGWVPALVAPVANRRLRPKTKAATEAAALLRQAADLLVVARSRGDGESAEERSEWEQTAQAARYFADCLVGPSDS